MLMSVCKNEILRMVYFALISYKIEDGIKIWGGTYITNIKPIITLQKYFIRIISNSSKYD